MGQTADPVLGVLGMSGVGKTATVDALVEHVTPAATPPGVVRLRPPAPAAGGRLRMVDVPGLGADLARDDDLLAACAAVLLNCDVVLWVLAARSRAIALDQMYLRRLALPAERTVFGLNQVDLLEPRDWDVRHNVPSARQAVRIADAAEHRKGVLGGVLRREIRVWPYSATTGYGLAELFAALVTAASPAPRPVLTRLRHAPEAGTPGVGTPGVGS